MLEPTTQPPQENLPTRNNNPGDLRDPETGSFRQFASPKEGYAALLNDLHAKQTGTTTTGLGPSSSLVDFAKKYAPSSDGNNSAQYAANLANKMGTRPDAQLKDLDLGKWADAIAQNEGYKGPTGQTQIAQAQPSDVPAANAAGSTSPSPSLGQQALGVAGKVGDFLFPAVKDVYNDVTGKNIGENHKSALQQAGDVGLTALSVLPGVGTIGKGLEGVGLLAKGARAAETAGLLGKAAQATKVGGEIAKASEAAPVVAKVAQGTSKLGTAAKTIGGGLAAGYLGDVSSKLSQGKTDTGEVLTPGLGTAVGGGLGAAGLGLGKVANAFGQKQISSLIKPPLKGYSYGKNPNRGVIEEGIVGNSLQSLADNIGKRKDEIGAAIGSIGKQVSDAKGIKLNLSSALKPIDKGLQEAAEQNNQTAFNRLQEVRRALTENLGVATDETGATVISSRGKRVLDGVGYNNGQDVKALIGKMTKWTGNPSDDKAVNATLQDVWRNVTKIQKDAAASLDPSLKTRLEQLNERYGDLVSAEAAARRRMEITSGHNVLGLGDKILGGGGLVTGLLTGGPLGAALGAAGGSAVSHIAGSTAVKSRVGRALARTAGASSLVKKPPVTKGLLPGLIKVGAIRAAASKQ